MNIDITEALLSGYTSYTDAEEFGASVLAELPGATPTVSIASSAPCVASVGSAIGSLVATIRTGC